MKIKNFYGELFFISVKKFSFLRNTFILMNFRMAENGFGGAFHDTNFFSVLRKFHTLTVAQDSPNAEFSGVRNVPYGCALLPKILTLRKVPKCLQKCFVVSNSKSKSFYKNNNVHIPSKNQEFISPPPLPH